MFGWLPYSDKANVRKQIKELLSPKMVGSFLVAKFMGDFAAIIMVDLFGVYIGYSVGNILTMSVFIYWNILERRVKQAQNKMNPSQTTMGKFQDGSE